MRIAPSLMISDLMSSFAINATTVASVAVAYYYTYALMQIPVGILLDNYNNRRLLVSASLAIVLGCALFAISQHIGLAIFARLLMGFGSAFAFVACIKLIHNWFPGKQLAFVIGLTNMVGILGAAFSEVPAVHLIEKFGWRQSMFIIAGIGCLIAIILKFFIHNEPSAIGYEPLNKSSNNKVSSSIWKGLKYVLHSRQTWLTAICGSLMVAPMAAFADLWSIPYLMHVFHMEKVTAAHLASFIFIGIAIGGPVNGALSGLFGRRKPFLIMGSLSTFLIITTIIYSPHLSHAAIGILLFAFGFFTGNMLLVYAVITEISPSWATGSAIGFTSMVVSVVGMISQPLVGFILDYCGNTIVQGATVTFPVSNYHYALAILPLSLLAAFFVALFIQETYCQINRTSGVES